MGAIATHRNILGVSSPKKFRVRAAIILVFVVWLYARLGDFAPTPQPLQHVAGPFARATPFIATPGDGFYQINARTGPGTEYPMQQQFARGVLLNGIARRFDRQGAYWIELQGGGGFVKETVLVSAAPVTS